MFPFPHFLMDSQVFTRNSVRFKVLNPLTNIIEGESVKKYLSQWFSFIKFYMYTSLNTVKNGSLFHSQEKVCEIELPLEIYCIYWA